MNLFSFGKKKKAEKNIEMLYDEGMTLIANGYWENAFGVISRAAEFGHRGAIGQLAMMYIFGQGCDEDRDKGIALLRESVKLGNVYSCYAFSVLYDNGIEQITADEAKSMCEIAANAGMEEAAERLSLGFDTEE